MADLSSKSAEEIRDLLDEYGVKHGPIVDSTRRLYEKKLREAMAKGKPSSDKTYYREEEEEVTYIHYHPPVRHEGCGDVVRRLRTTENSHDDLDDLDEEYEEPMIARTQASYHSASYSRPTISQASTPKPTAAPPNPQRPASTQAPKAGGIPGWLRFLVFVVIAVFLYYVYSSMEAEEENPFNQIESA